MQEEHIHPEQEQEAKKSSVLQKEISSATPDKAVSVSQEVAQKLLQSDDAVRPFSQGDDKFRAFFTTTAAVLPKDMQTPPVPKEQAQTEVKPEKKNLLSRLRGLFATSTQDDEVDEELDDLQDDALLEQNLFFPEGVSAPKVPFAQEETLSFDLLEQAQPVEATTAQPAAVAKPSGKVRFVKPVPVQVEEPAQAPAMQEVQEIATQEVKPVASAVETAAPAQIIAPKDASTNYVLAQDPTDALVAEILSQVRAQEAARQDATQKVNEPVAPTEVEAQSSVISELALEAASGPTPAPETSAQEDAEIAPVDASLDLADVPQAPVPVLPALEPTQQVLLDGLEENLFDDLSQETAFLREECEQRTTAHDNVFTRMGERVHDWKEGLLASVTGRKADAQDDIAPEEALSEEAMAELDLIPLPQEEKAPLSTEEMLAFEDIDAPAVHEEHDLTFATVQTAFVARASAQDGIELPAPEQATSQEAVAENVLAEEAIREEVAPEEVAASVEGTILEEEAVLEETVPSVEEKDVLEEVAAAAEEVALEGQVISEEAAPVEETALEETTAQEAPEAEIALEEQAISEEEVRLEDEAAFVEKATIAQEASAQEAAPVQDPVPPAQRDYCLFDQAADEAAAELQIGEIGFVGAVPPVLATPSTEGKASGFFASLAQAIEEPAPAAFATQEMHLLDDTLLADRAAQETAEEPFAQTMPRVTQKAEQSIPEDGEGIQFGLSGMRMKLLVRTILTAVFAVLLLLLGLMGQGVISALPGIDPVSAPVPFLLVNLLFMLAAAGVSYSILIEGVLGLWKTPSPDTPVALAAIAALLQLLVCLTFADQFEPGLVTLFSALAGVALFADTLGSFVMAQVMQGNFNLYAAGVPHHLAYRVQAKDTVRTLSSGVEVDQPALLLSRPVQQMTGFLEKSFSDRASDQRAQWIAYGLSGAAVLAALISLLSGQGALGAVSNLAAVLCVGAPLSITLVSALPSLFLHRAAAKVGAMVPGWQSIEALGNINLLAVDAKELFPPLCAQLHGIKTFQKERIDLAILYATSILVQGCDTLQNLFAGMIEYKQEMLYPVKDLVNRPGLGFIGWCENYRVILGTRALMQAEGVPLPALDYENRYSKDGKRQVLYLSVSGQLYAMFLLGYRGEKSIARSLRTLRKEHIRLLVNSTDPTLTAARIAAVYHLPEGFVTLLSAQQGETLASATDYRPEAEGCMLHLGNFASLVGGLKAAAGAAQAERSASAIQLVWAGFSILLGLFLCITGGLMQVALIAIILYQIAWSVLSLGVVLTKKFE